MNILTIEHVHKIYGEKVILEDVTFGIHEGDKIGIVGINGTGKTTLLHMIAGIVNPDDGQIIMQNGLKVGYLPQNPEYPPHVEVLSYVMDEKGGDWTLESEAKNILNKLGMTDYEKPMEQLSGGQRKKVALAKVLIEPCEVLLLDEPTNHLDYEMLTWLEQYLTKRKGVVVMVTHDRYFLDKVCNKIVEVSHGALYSYDANYSTFLELKAEREEMELASERKRQSVLRMELEWAKRGCRARTTKQKARLDRLEALKQGMIPGNEPQLQVDTAVTRMGNKTVELHRISKAYGERTLVNEFEYIVSKNQRLGIIGPNGCGKSTLLKIIAGVIAPDSGHIEVGETIKMGYFAQEVPDMDSNQKVIDYIKEVAEYIPTKEGSISASQMLERFLFTSDMQYAPVNKLSGGEKKRLYLLKVIFEAPNVFLFDEISNDIDIPTLTILEDYINSFQGIVITVSHDRYFLDNVVDRILEINEGGHILQYEGGYTEYLEKKTDEKVEIKGKEKKKAESKDWRKDRPVKLKFSYQEQREYECIDEEIAGLEDAIKKVDEDMMTNATNSAKLSELSAEKERLELMLEERTERWVYLSELEEKIALQE